MVFKRAIKGTIKRSYGDEDVVYTHNLPGEIIKAVHFNKKKELTQKDFFWKNKVGEKPLVKKSVFFESGFRLKEKYFDKNENLIKEISKPDPKLSVKKDGNKFLNVEFVFKDLAGKIIKKGNLRKEILDKINNPIIKEVEWEIQHGINLSNLDLINDELEMVSFLLKDETNLNSLYLGKNIQIDDFSSLKELKSLKELSLIENNISDISFLKDLETLEKLHLTGNQIEDISVLKNLKHMNYVSLSGNRIQDISALSELKRLRKLFLSQNKIQNLSPVKNLFGLDKLTLSSNGIMDVSYLKDLRNLEELDLRDNNINDISSIKKLKKLNKLFLNENNLIESEVKNTFENTRVFIELGKQKSKNADEKRLLEARGIISEMAKDIGKKSSSFFTSEKQSDRN